MPSPETILGARNNLVVTTTHLVLGASTLFSLNFSFSKFQSKLCENRTSSFTHLRLSSPKHLLRSKPRVGFFFVWTGHSKTKFWELLWNLADISKSYWEEIMILSQL
jgi:hypothetical protein